MEITVDHVPLYTAPNKRIRFCRFDSVTNDQLGEISKWCSDNLYHGGHYEPNWFRDGRTFYFYDEQEYLAFLLRWK